MIERRTARLGLGLTVLLASLAGAGAAPAARAPEVRCGRAIVIGSNRIIRTDTRALSRCVLAVLEPASPGETEDLCGRLRTPGLRVDRADGRARSRIERRCSRLLPPWPPASCPGPGPAQGTPLDDAGALARCTTSSSHCLALSTLESLFVDPITPLLSQHPDNLAFEFGGIADNSFSACLDAVEPPTTTTTLAPTTTTTLAPATTTTTLATATTTTTTLAPGGPPRLVITEVMANPAAQSDSVGEYFEILNAGPDPVDLDGMVVSDLGSDSFTVAGSVVVTAGGFAVFAKSASAADGLGAYVYGSGMNLTNSEDEIVLAIAGEVVDTVAYDASFPMEAGHAMSLDPASHDATANDQAASWCSATTPLGDGDFGSPGAAGETCPR